jgi:hypothetical protein
MPEKMGKSLDDKLLKSPLTVGRPKGEKGPDVHNSPVMHPPDPLKFIPGGGKKGK